MKAKYGFHAFVHGKTFSEKEIALAHLVPLYLIDRLRVKPVRPISHLASFSLTYSLLKSYSICLMPERISRSDSFRFPVTSGSVPLAAICNYSYAAYQHTPQRETPRLLHGTRVIRGEQPLI